MWMPYRILFVLLAICLIKCRLWRDVICLAEFDYAATVPLRGLLAFFIVCGHCDNMMPGNKIVEMLHITAPSVAVFFFMSGFGYVKQHQSKGVHYINQLAVPSFIKLFVPLGMAYVLWQVVARFFLSRPVNESLIPPHSWYVYALAGFTLLFVFVTKLSERMMPMLLAASMLIWYCIGSVMFPQHVEWWITSPSFAVGVLWATHEKKILGLIKRNILVATVVVACTVFLIYCLYVLVPGRFSCLRDLRLWMIGPIVAYTSYIMGPIRSTCLGFLGGISYEIYLLHCIPEFCFSGLFCHPVAYLAGTFLSAMALAWLIKKPDQIIISFLKKSFHV